LSYKRNKETSKADTNFKSESSWEKFISQFALLWVAIIWGWTFILVKESLTEVGTFTFLFYRFTLALLLLLAIFGKRLCRAIKSGNNMFRVWGKGCIIGTALFSGYFFQTLGLNYTTATNSAFITGLCVVLVPIIYGIILRNPVTKISWFGAFLSVIGLSFIVVRSVNDLYSFNIGDLLTLFCAFSFALHIVLISNFTIPYNYVSILVAQIGTVVLFSGFGMVAFEKISFPSSWLVWKGIFITGIFATAIAFWIQNRFQPLSTATRTAIIFSGEPVFAGISGYLFLGERLTGWQWLGALFILIAMLIAQLPSRINSTMSQIFWDD